MSGVEVEVDAIVRETDEAVLVIYEGEEVWLPLSQIDSMRKGQNPSITAARWILEKKGML